MSFSFDDIVEQDQCDEASQAAVSACHNMTGAFCIFESNVDKPYACRMEAGISESVERGTSNCKLY